MKLQVIAVCVPLLGLAWPAGQGGDEAVTVSSVRFFRPSDASTTIEAVCEVSLPVLLREAAGEARYRVEVAVLDSAGLELQHADWSRSVPASLAHRPGATITESFGFTAAAGRYRVRIRLSPSVGAPVERAMDVTAYAVMPATSDLVLATAVRQPASDSEPLMPGEIRRAGLALRIAPVPRVSPDDPALSWYAEIYPRAGVGAGEIQAEIMGTGGRRIVTTPPRTVSVPAAGGRTSGSLDLSGLPEGAYTLRLRVRLGDSSVAVEAPFSMGPPPAAVAAAPAAATGSSADDPFESASEARLDSLEAPLVYATDSQQDLGVYRSLTVDGRRRFLQQFWERFGAAHHVPAARARDEFYRAVDHANEAFREAGAARIPGWNTDRGRIYLKNGRPDETLSRPAASPSGFEVWKYTRGQPRWYIFQDQTGMGHYGLLATSDRHESGSRQQNWETSLGADGIRDAYAFLGMDLRNLGNGNP